MNLEEQIAHEIKHLLNADPTPGVIGQAIKWSALQRELSLEARLEALEQRLALLEKQHLPRL